jgi:hypothetical protein
MATEDLLVDYGGHRQAVETVCERLPQLDVVPSLACKGKLLSWLINSTKVHIQ